MADFGPRASISPLINLNYLSLMSARFDLESGFSPHSLEFLKSLDIFQARQLLF